MRKNHQHESVRPFKAAKAISLIWIGSILAAGLTFLLQALIARQLGPEQFGLFASSLAAVTLLSPVAGFGVSQVWLKMYGRERSAAQRWIVPSLRFNAFTVATVTFLIVGWALAGPHESSTGIVLLILSAHASGQASVELISSKFQLEEKYRQLAIWQILPSLVRFFALLVLISLNLVSAVTVASIYALTAAALFLFGNYHARLLIKKGVNAPCVEGEGLSGIGFKRVAREAWPFGLAALFNMIYSQVDVVFIKYMVGNGEAGIYNIAYTVLLATYLLPGAIFQKYLMPKIHRWSVDNPEMLKQVFRRGNAIMLAVGIFIMVLIWSTSWVLVPLVFGSEYQSSVRYLNILSLSVPLMFVAFSAGSILVSGENMRTKVWIMGFVAIFNIVVNLMVVPVYGALGASVTTVVSNLILMSVYIFYAKAVINARCSEVVNT